MVGSDLQPEQVLIGVGVVVCSLGNHVEQDAAKRLEHTSTITSVYGNRVDIRCAIYKCVVGLVYFFSVKIRMLQPVFFFSFCDLWLSISVN